MKTKETIFKIIKYFLYVLVTITFLASLLAIFCFVYGSIILKTSYGLPGVVGIVLLIYGMIAGFFSAIPGIVMSLILKLKYKWNTITFTIFLLFHIVPLIASCAFLYIANNPEIIKKHNEQVHITTFRYREK